MPLSNPFTVFLRSASFVWYEQTPTTNVEELEIELDEFVDGTWEMKDYTVVEAVEAMEAEYDSDEKQTEPPSKLHASICFSLWKFAILTN